jgi:hypothetical protein
VTRPSLLYRNAALLYCAALAFASLWMMSFLLDGWQKKLRYFREIGGVFTQADRNAITVLSARVTDGTYLLAFGSCGLALLLCAVCAWAVLRRRRWTGWLLGTLWLGGVAGTALGYTLLRATEGVYWRRSPFLRQFYIAAVPLELAAVALLFVAAGYTLLRRSAMSRPKDTQPSA